MLLLINIQSYTTDVFFVFKRDSHSQIPLIIYSAICQSVNLSDIQRIHNFAYWNVLHLVAFNTKCNEYNYFAFSKSTLQEWLSQENTGLQTVSSEPEKTLPSLYNSTVLLNCNFNVAWLFLHVYKSHHCMSQS